MAVAAAIGLAIPLRLPNPASAAMQVCRIVDDRRRCTKRARACCLNDLGDSTCVLDLRERSLMRAQASVIRGRSQARNNNHVIALEHTAAHASQQLPLGKARPCARPPGGRA